MFIIVSPEEFEIVGLRTTKELAAKCVEFFQPNYVQPLVVGELDVDPTIPDGTDQEQSRNIIWKVNPS